MYQIFTYQIDPRTMKKLGEGQSVELFDSIVEAEKHLPEFQVNIPTFRQIANIGKANLIGGAA